MKENVELTEQIYTTMIKVYSKVYKLGKADEMFQIINNPDITNYATFINACIRCKNMDKAERIVSEMTDRGIEKNMSIYSLLLNGYRIAKNYDKCIRLYENIKYLELGTSFYNSILDCCLESQRYELGNIH